MDNQITKPFETEAELRLISKDLKDNAQALTIEGEAGVKEAKTLKKQIAAYTKDVAGKRLDFTRQLDHVKKQAMDLEREIVADAKDADEIVRSKMLAYEQELEEKRKAEEARLNQIAKDWEAATVALAPKIIDEETLEEAKTLAIAHFDGIASADQKTPILLAAKARLLSNFEEQLLAIQRIMKTEAERVQLEIKQKEEQIARALELEKAQKVAAKTNAAPRFGARTKLVIEITNPDLVPRIFCTPDIAKIRDFAKNQNIAELEIPGVKLTEERTI